MPFQSRFTKIDGPYYECAACSIEVRVRIPATYTMNHSDSTGNREYHYCSKHANRIAVDMRITGGIVTIDGESINLPIPYDVEAAVELFKARWFEANDKFKEREREKEKSNVPRQDYSAFMKPKKKKEPRKPPKESEDFSWDV